MKPLRNPLLLATIGVVVIGTVLAQTLFWLRVGDGLTFKRTSKTELTPVNAKEEAAKWKQVYVADKEYYISNTDQVTVYRGFFPFTYEETVSLQTGFVAK